MVLAKKKLGQHWLHDEDTLNYICERSVLSRKDTVLEIGPGTGTLTKKLLARGAHVVAVEKDKSLAKNLPYHIPPISKVEPWKHRLEVVVGDILEFDLTRLPAGYKVVANIPYYLTSNLLRFLAESVNPPLLMVLLVQKEVAARIAAKPGQMSLLSVSVQLYYESELGRIVPAKLFSPPPKVDSQVVILKHRHELLFTGLNPVNRAGKRELKKFFRVVRAGFSERRKKLRSSLSGGLGISKDQADELLRNAGIAPAARAQELSLHQWYELAKLI
ncbi:ribosomal RNA small subunit methyltransferase A [Candidatus Saccharibacteria bacterium]|nr:ribosomal RNA small subunit methyltransferase A [Candidatus Saccharibacteria bacterium]